MLCCVCSQRAEMGSFSCIFGGCRGRGVRCELPLTRHHILLCHVCEGLQPPTRNPEPSLKRDPRHLPPTHKHKWIAPPHTSPSHSCTGGGVRCTLPLPPSQLHPQPATTFCFVMFVKDYIRPPEALNPLSKFKVYFPFRSLISLHPGFAFISKAWLVPGSLLRSVVRRRQSPLFVSGWPVLRILPYSGLAPKCNIPRRELTFAAVGLCSLKAKKKVFSEAGDSRWDACKFVQLFTKCAPNLNNGHL